VADQYNKKRKGPFIPRTESQKILTAEEMGSKIQNMVVTEEGTLRSACGPAPYVPDYGAGYPSYQTMHGIHHSVSADTGRDMLLIHTGNQLWVHQGWNIDFANPDATWEVLLGPSTANPLRADEMPDTKSVSFPTQFESTPAGTVIVPQGGRSYFYDGTTIAPLGYDRAPASPAGDGPLGDNCMSYAKYPSKSGDHVLKTSGSSEYFVDLETNQRGYAKDGSTTWSHGSDIDNTGMHPDFGFCKIGTLQVSPGVHAATNTATLLPGTWQCKTQWIDRWGNLSPLSQESNPVTVEQQRGDWGSPWGLSDPTQPEIQDSYYNGFRSARLLKQFLWHSVSPGPEGTVGRVLSRTKDKINSGSIDYFEIISDVGGSLSNFCTIPDNVSTLFPDNFGDEQLGSIASDVRPVPIFKLCRVAFGRLWVANLTGQPGAVVPSMPGRWGTFEKGIEYQPDPTGAEVTALWRAFGGLFVFTSNSTFLIKPSATVRQGETQGYVIETLNSGVGCVGPGAIQTMQDGSLVWLGLDGFYRASTSRKEGLQIVPVSEEIERTIRNLNKPRLRAAVSVVDKASGEYRCWVPDQNSTINNLCLVYDGSGWRRRTDTQAKSACTTVDHRQYCLVGGTSLGTTTAEGGTTIGYTGTDTTTTSTGLWVLDHEVASFVPNQRDYIVETSWLAGLRSMDRKTAFTVYIWLRETTDSQLSVEVYRDWRMKVVHTETVNTYSTEDAPPFWGSASLSTANEYKLRRPFWVKADLFLPACESFRLRLTSQTPFEFVGISVSEGSPDDSGMRIPK
tara:strand:- start:6298 stop:8664 length:2367 start_codon:yes stop_codon:yes gene_type:complete